MHRCQYLASLVILLASLMNCSSNKKDPESRERFPITYPVLKDTFYTTEYVADIHSIQNIELRARVKGFMEFIHIDEGQYVNAGQLLFSISSQVYRQELLKAKAMLASAVADAKASEVDLTNTKTLVEKNIVSKSELDLAQAKLEAFMAKIEEAKAHEASAALQLSFAQVKAPFSGIINRIPKKVGSLIDEGELLTTLSDNKEVFAYFHVSEKEYLDFNLSKDAGKKREVLLTLANNITHTYKGRIEIVEGEVDKSTGNIAFRARFPNPELVLKHGSTGKVRLIHEVRNALLVPQKSTFEIQDNLYVFVVDNNNKVRQRKIVPSFRLPHWYVISSGLSVNEKIIYEGIQKVKEGDKVETWAIQLFQAAKQ